MTDQLKALLAVLAIGIVQIFLVVCGHLAGWPEPTIGSILFIGMALYTTVIVWLVRQTRAHKAHSPGNSN